uniref:Uncharacterized protein n=1 Tax=Fagus sylvatica TaxID=28930 RepID=A0A2N9FNZ4_FAGSY
MFSMRKMNPFLSLFLASCFFFISHSQTTSNTSSQHHCLPNQSHTLLQLRQEFVQKRLNSDYWRYDYYNGSYPKMKSWKADSDCCSWDGVTCDPENGHVVGLNLTNSWLNGRLNSNSSLFSLRHLHKLNLALNNFSSSTIPSQFGHLLSLTHLNLSRSFLSGRIPSEISWLSNLVSLDLSHNYFEYFVGGSDDYIFMYLNLRRIDLEALVQNMTYLRELHLDVVNISSSLPQSLSLPKLQILVLRVNGCHGPIWDPRTKFGLSKLHVIDLSHNDFSGKLPSKYFETWNAMLMVSNKDKSQPEYMGDDSNYYKDSMTVVNKGREMELVKILTIFKAIDLSNNNSKISWHSRKLEENQWQIRRQDSNVFSVRIVSIDYYMAAPTTGLDFCYSTFQGGKVNEVPVIRIYGSTPTGQKTCLHIHKVLPYLYVPCADISLQPHKEGDAHTQAVFLALEKALKIDYNLYGMGHMHLSKMKFRHPVPDTFSPRKSDLIGLQNQNMDKLTCMANDFQADPNCDASLSLPILISSTIPADWIWQFPSEFEASSHQDVCCVKRQSVCELEGDASIDDILNQQFKNYSSLSQTHSEVKMVQSHVPIWEEEYERTGMRDVAMPSDPSKPLPDDVLRTLSLGQQTNFHEAYEVKAAHSDSSMYGKLPLLYSSDSSSQASRAKDGNFGSHGKVGDEARIGAITGNVDFTVIGSSECQSLQDVGARLTRLRSSESVVVNTQAKCRKLIGITFCKKPPIADWTDGASFTLTTSNPKEDNFDGSSGSASSLIITQSSLLDDCDKAQSFLPDDCEKDLLESGSAFHVKPILDHLYQENPKILNAERSAFDDGVTTVIGDAYTQAESFALEIALKVNKQNFCEAYEVKAAHSDSSIYCKLPLLYTSDSSSHASRLKDGIFGSHERSAPGGNNVALVDSSPLKCSASSLIGTQSSLPHDCDKVQSFLPDDCDKDLPESGSGSHVKPILDHLYQENPRILDRERSAFGDGVTTIMQDGKSKPTTLSQSGFRNPASVGGGQQLTLLSIEVQAESSRDLRSDPRFDAINVIALAIQNDTDSIPEVYVLLRSKTEGFKSYGC